MLLPHRTTPRLLSASPAQIHLLAKFVKGTYEKVDKLPEIQDNANSRLKVVDTEIEAEKKELIGDVDLVDEEGAYVMLLVPFVPSLNTCVTEWNVDDISTIFDVTSATPARASAPSAGWVSHSSLPTPRPTPKTSYSYLRPLLIFAHIPLQTFFDFNAVFVLIQIALHPSPSHDPHNWALAVAAAFFRIACYLLP